MEFVIEEAKSLTEFQDAWKRLMQKYYWFNKNPIFDWNSDRELEEMVSEYDDPGYHFYVACLKDQSHIIGLLRVSMKGQYATMERWEPVVENEEQYEEVAIALIDKAIEQARKEKKQAILCVIKYHISSNQALWHQNLFGKLGFIDVLGEGTDLMMDLPDMEFELQEIENVRIATVDEYDAETIARLTVDCFTSTEEDRRIHKGHRSVTDYDVSLEVTKDQLSSENFFCPSDCWQVAVYDGKPIGTVGSMIPKMYSEQHLGILGPVGMLPSYRRKGITSMLIRSVLNSLMKRGCTKVAVGTPSHNQSALAMYKKIGFKDHGRILWFRRELDYT